MQIVDGIYQLLTPFPQFTFEDAKVLRRQLEEHPRVTKGLPVRAPVPDKHGGDITLVDCGWNTDSAYAALEVGMKEHGSHPIEINELVITHVHPDHYGMAGRLKRSPTARSSSTREDAEVINKRYFAPKGLIDDMSKFMDHERRAPRTLANMAQGSMGMLGMVSAGAARYRGQRRRDVQGRRLRLRESSGRPAIRRGTSACTSRTARSCSPATTSCPTITPNVSIHAQTHGSPLGDYMRSLRS